ncbi:MAG: hypothetical protein AAFU67_02400 [Bacteroidota bacterium]
MLHLGPNQSLDLALEQLRQDLVNLPVFHRATYHKQVTSNETLVRWELSESQTLFPLISFGGVRDNFFYQIGFSETHLQGLGRELTAFYGNNDGENNYYFSIGNPSLKGGKWGYRLEHNRYAAVEPLYFPEEVNYQYINLNTGLGGSYTFRPGRSIHFGANIFRERYRKVADAPEGSPGPDEVEQWKGLLKFRLSQNKLNYRQERVEGTNHQTILQGVYNFADHTNFFIGWHDFHYFQTLGKRGNLALRLRAGISTNDNSPFAPFVLDSQVNIRGSGNRIDRGTAQLILNLEYRHTIWRDKKDRFAAQLVAFNDLGNWRSPGGTLEDLIRSDNVRYFAGAGIRLINLRAWNSVVRLDYGIDLLNTRERGLVLGFGQYF